MHSSRFMGGTPGLLGFRRGISAFLKRGLSKHRLRTLEVRGRIQKHCICTLQFLLCLLAGGEILAQEIRYGWEPGKLDRVIVVLEANGGNAAPSIRTNTVSAGTAIHISDSGFVLTGQSMKFQNPPSPPQQPILNGVLNFNFPSVTPDRAPNGAFLTPLPVSGAFEGSWTKGAQGFSYQAAEVRLFPFEPTFTPCLVPPTSRTKTGAPISVGNHPVSIAADCAITHAQQFNTSPTEVEEWVRGKFQAVAGSDNPGTDQVVPFAGLTATYYAIYKARKRPQIGLLLPDLVFIYTDFEPLPAPRIGAITNTGGQPLTWTGTATPNSGNNSWLKLDPPGGSLEPQTSQPIQLSIDPTGLAQGTYYSTLKFTGNNSNGSQEYRVTLRVNGAPRWTLSRTNIEFFNTTAFPSQPLILANTGSAPGTYQITAKSEKNWMSVNSISGTIYQTFEANLTVSALESPPPDFEPLDPGDYPGEIRIDFTPLNSSGASQTNTIPTVYHVRPKQDSLEIVSSSVTPLTSEIVELDKEYTTFGADVSYELVTRGDADLALRLFDEKGVLQASSDFIRVKSADGKVPKRHLSIPAVKITSNAQGIAPEQLFLRAVLIDRSLNTPLLSTSDQAYTYPVQSTVELQLGDGGTLETFEKRKPSVVYAYYGRAGQFGDWPSAAVVKVRKSPVLRSVVVQARLLDVSLRPLFFKTTAKLIPADFEGRIFFAFGDAELHEEFYFLPEKVRDHRANFVQFRATVYDRDNLNFAESQQIDIPVERINIISIDPPQGSEMLRSLPVTFKATVEYNVPFLGLRRIERREGLVPIGAGPFPVLHQGTLGPGQGRTNLEFEVIPGKEKENDRTLNLQLALVDPNEKIYAEHSASYSLADPLVITTAPNQTVGALDATLRVHNSPTARSVRVASPNISLAAVTDDGNPAGGGFARQTQPRSAHRHAESPIPLKLSDLITLHRVWHFSPPISSGAGFGADLTLTYNPEDLPDDPNFSPGAMKVISLNSSTGQIRTYSTTINLQTGSATAAIDSLESYYTLGVVGPFLQRVLNLPLLTDLQTIPTRLIINAGSVGTSVQIKALGSVGKSLNGDGIVSPITKTLNANASFSNSVATIFALPTQSFVGWLQVIAGANSDALQLIDGGAVMDAVTAPATTFPRILFPGVEADTNRTVLLRLANPTRFTSPVVLEFHNATGSTVGKHETTVDGLGILAGSLNELFPGIGPHFSGYVTATADTDFAGAVFDLSNSTLSTISGQALEHRTEPRLVAPGFVTGGNNYRARLTLVNTGPASANLTLRALGDTGTELTPPRPVTILPGAQYSSELGTLFGLGTATSTSATLVVEGNSDGIFGEVTELDASSANLFRTSSALLAEAATRHAFGYLDNTAGRFTEVSLWNPDANPTLLSVTVYRNDGTTVGSVPLKLGGNARTNRKLSDLIPLSTGLTGGAFVVESSQPVFASAFTGELSLNSLTALPAHIGNAVSPPVDSGPLKADYRFQQSLASTVAGAPDLIPFGPAGTFAKDVVDGLEQTVLQFERGYGLTLEGFSPFVPSNTWSMCVLFRFDELGGYRRVIDLWNMTSDHGLYISGEVPYYYNEAFSGIPAVHPHAWTQIVLTRDTSENVMGYVDSNLIFQFKDVAGKALPQAGNNLGLFRDNNGEHGGPGAIARFRLYERALTSAEVAALDRVALPPGPFELTALLAEGKIHLSWSADAVGFVLQAKSDTDPAVPWSTLAIAPEVAAGRKSVSLDPSGSSRFFRLTK